MGRGKRALIDRGDREKISHDFSTTFWVEAGAGTGKTTLLIKRLINLVAIEGAHLDRVVAVTFTEKAAGEIKERLREGLEQELTADLPDRQRDRIIRALGEIEYAPIKTIHSFATSLLRERPVEAGIDPLFRVLDAEETESLCSRAWDDWFLEELDANRAILERALDFKFSESHLRELALLLYNHRDIVEEGSSRDVPALTVESFMASLESEFQLVTDLAGSCVRRDDAGYQQYIEFADWLGANRLLKNDDLLKSILFLMPEARNKGNKKNWSPPERCTTQKKIFKYIRGAQERIKSIIVSSIIDEIIDWLKDYLGYVEEKKREAGVLDFNDLLIKARDLLKDNIEIRGYFQKRYSHLLIDEFQDTDPLQAEIIFFLAEKEPLAVNWNEVKIIPGKLFIVGDPKQAIYRFRRADIEIYEEAKKLVMEQGKVVKIIQNFRTVPS
ncbi:MAG: UvrD-helicase domain-containing protein, partial [Firmicutes bacterium]|nr:UvrD-helicase domain-containing protein [Bacillota bacterium]